MSAYERAEDAAAWLRQQLPYLPKYGLTLGTGGGGSLDFMEETMRIPYGDIPHFIAPSVKSHQGSIILGMVGDTPLAVLAGRSHYYEGLSIQEIVHPVRTLGRLGCAGMIFTNAAGGLHPDQQAGDLVLLRDHINLIPDNPLRGQNDERLGPRFPDMSDAYDAAWRQLGMNAASRIPLRLLEGTYVSLPGPNMETPAEYTWLHRIGGDLVGMSTVPEVIAARHMGMKVAGLSVVSNVCYPPERIQATTVEMVIAAVNEAHGRLYLLLKEWIPTLK